MEFLFHHYPKQICHHLHMVTSQSLTQDQRSYSNQLEMVQLNQQDENNGLLGKPAKSAPVSENGGITSPSMNTSPCFDFPRKIKMPSLG